MNKIFTIKNLNPEALLSAYKERRARKNFVALRTECKLARSQYNESRAVQRKTRKFLTASQVVGCAVLGGLAIASGPVAGSVLGLYALRVFKGAINTHNQGVRIRESAKRSEVAAVHRTKIASSYASVARLGL